MLVRVRGTIYQSVQSAADALGLTQNAVYGAIARGKEDLLGTGKTIPKKTVIGEVEFRSMRAASLALGLNHRLLGDVKKRGGKLSKKRVEDAIASHIQEAEQP